MVESSPFDVFLPPEPPTNLQAVAYGPQVLERETKAETERERDRETERQRERETERHRYIDKDRDRERDRQRDVCLSPEPPTNLQAAAYRPQVPRGRGLLCRETER